MQLKKQCGLQEELSKKILKRKRSEVLEEGERKKRLKTAQELHDSGIELIDLTDNYQDDQQVKTEHLQSKNAELYDDVCINYLKILLHNIYYKNCLKHCYIFQSFFSETHAVSFSGKKTSGCDDFFKMHRLCGARIFRFAAEHFHSYPNRRHLVYQIHIQKQNAAN